MEKGYVHIYCGDGKGKTTAAVGLSVRAAGSGIPVLFVQFLKDGTSSEIRVLEKIPEITVLCADKDYGFYISMDDAEKLDAKKNYMALLEKAILVCRQSEGNTRRILVLDEIMAACNYGLVDQEFLLSFLADRPEGLEVVMTGRNPQKELCEIADYITEMKKQKHPYDQGLTARIGIEL